MKKTTLAATTALAVAFSMTLAACSGDTNKDSNTAASATQATDPGEKGFDIDKIQTDPKIAAMVPENIKKTGVLTNGTAADYAPAQYKKADGQTPTGYGVDTVRAIAKVMGLKAETSNATFETLLPQVGSKFDISESSFTITPEREKQYDMISYIQVGFSYAVPKGNPGGFDPKSPCGKIIGVQTGTAQLEAMQELSKQCEKEGKKPIDLKPLKVQSEITPKVLSGQYDATVADSPIIGYMVKMTNGKLERIGDQFDSATQGIVVSKKDPQLAKAVQAALQKLMDDGTFKDILSYYGSPEIALNKAEINPKVD